MGLQGVSGSLGVDGSAGLMGLRVSVFDRQIT